MAKVQGSRIRRNEYTWSWEVLNSTLHFSTDSPSGLKLAMLILYLFLV